MSHSLAHRTVSRVLGGALSVLAVGGLTAACSPSPEPTENGVSGAAPRAHFCSELDNPETVEATRAATGLDEEGMARLLAACETSTTNDFIDDLLPSLTDGSSAAQSQTPDSALSALEQTFPITDDKGYTFDLGVDFQLRSVTADPASQPPGLTAASRYIDVAMSLTNTTTARALTFKDVSGITSPLNLPTFLISAVYDEGNPVCVGLKIKHSCEWPMAYGRMESGLTIPSGETYTLTIGAVPNGAGYDATLLKGLPESSWDEIYPSLTHPDGYEITYSGGDGRRFAPACGGPTPAPPIVWTAPCPAS